MKSIFIATLIAFIPGISCLDDSSYEIICESSDASPYIMHTEELIENLKSDDDTETICYTSLSEGSCGGTKRKWSGGGGAVIALCRTKGDDLKLQCVSDGVPKRPCEIDGEASNECGGLAPCDIADLLEELKNECERKERAGGRIMIDGGGEVRLYTMPGFQAEQDAENH